MRRQPWVMFVLGLFVLAGRALAECKLGQLAELPVTMMASKPMITAKINGADARFIADSGAFYSMITPASAAQLKLHLGPAPWGLIVRGTNGNAQVSLATVKDFSLANITVHNVQFLVGGTDFGDESVGLLGQNVFRIGDVEYDLANGVIRLWRTDGCGHSVLAYWAQSNSQPITMMDIDSTTPLSPHTTGTAYINGVKIHVLFDTGASTSSVTLGAAKRAGITPDSPGVTPGGTTYGIGSGTVKTWIAPFSSLKIGDEEIRNTQLRIADGGPENSDMLIGADFFLSHRIYVASSQHRLYFTYNGGPVFNLKASQVPPAAADDSAPAESSADAAEFARRGTASAARHDYEHAIADLSRACDLAPNESSYFYERAIARWQNKQPDLAMADLDRAIELKPSDVLALAARAGLRLGSGDIAAATADLDAAGRFSAPEADIRLTLAQDYERADLVAPAAAQYDLWIAAHPKDARLATALSGRCRLGAISGQDLDRALSDCNAAVKIIDKSNPDNSHVFDGRGLVRLRMNDFNGSIADYDAALKLRPKNSWALYGRGVDKLRLGKNAEAQADMSAAAALRPSIADDFAKRGIRP